MSLSLSSCQSPVTLNVPITLFPSLSVSVPISLGVPVSVFVLIPVFPPMLLLALAYGRLPGPLPMAYTTFRIKTDSVVAPPLTGNGPRESSNSLHQYDKHVLVLYSQCRNGTSAVLFANILRNPRSARLYIFLLTAAVCSMVL
ncbi:hypothetical protein P4O66_010046 [Electrophorus voltai]|uniref:Uncharacterized protein n=1 Tax=Electrophorus voltai TaxID=2609070 RepID=A0AAD8Z8K7_9TELE|nr:hypothetical protein P4O66_010046 [Electrophorus voltai]